MQKTYTDAATILIGLHLFIFIDKPARYLIKYGLNSKSSNNDLLQILNSKEFKNDCQYLDYKNKNKLDDLKHKLVYGDGPIKLTLFKLD